MNISFCVAGYCNQRIQLTQDCPLTEREIIEGLNAGAPHILTTIQENGDLVLLKSDGEEVVLGKVVDSNMEAEYTEFELRNTELVD